MPVSSHEDIPRITVESIADWRRIEASYTQVAIQQLDEQLVTNGLTHERDEHLKLLHSFLRKTFDNAKMNVRVNGRNLEDADVNQEDLDSYDENLDKRVVALSNQRLEWNKVVAQKRRTVPQDVEKLMSDVLLKQREADEEISQELMQLSVEPLPDAFFKPLVDGTSAVELKRAIDKAGELAEASQVQLERAQRITDVAKEIQTPT